MKRLLIAALIAALAMGACGRDGGGKSGGMVVGFSQIGSESG